MRVFNRLNRQEFEEFLLLSYVHDSRIQTIEVDISKRTIKIVLVNRYDCVGYSFCFREVSAAYGFEGEWIGEKDMVLGVVLEDQIPVESLKSFLHKEISEDEFHLLFQLFSGSEIHIISSEVGVESWEN